ncbi:MAG: hypothetical protein WDO13_15765 [Verrucomicrobiota bacterium]
MVTAIDLGNPTEIHPVDKLHVGERLAALARNQVYGEAIPARGPAYASMQVEGKRDSDQFCAPTAASWSSGARRGSRLA